PRSQQSVHWALLWAYLHSLSMYAHGAGGISRKCPMRGHIATQLRWWDISIDRLIQERVSTEALEGLVATDERRYAASRPTPSETTPRASAATPAYSSTMKRLGAVTPRPAAERKNPAGMSTAAAQMPLRARTAGRPLRCAASARIWPTRA